MGGRTRGCELLSHESAHERRLFPLAPAPARHLVWGAGPDIYSTQPPVRVPLLQDSGLHSQGGCLGAWRHSRAARCGGVVFAAAAILLRTPPVHAWPSRAPAAAPLLQFTGAKTAEVKEQERVEEQKFIEARIREREVGGDGGAAAHSYCLHWHCVRY